MLKDILDSGLNILNKLKDNPKDHKKLIAIGAGVILLGVSALALRGEKKFNHKTDRHSTALWKTEMSVNKSVRAGLYECVQALETSLKRAPYGIEIVLKYIKDKQWFNMPKLFYIVSLNDMMKEDILYTDPTFD